MTSAPGFTRPFRRLGFISLGFGLLALGLVSQPASAQGDPAKEGHIRLHVIDDETGEPIAGAFVRVKGRTPDQTTDAAGKVTVHDLPAGRVSLEIGAIGYEMRKEPMVIQAGTTGELQVGLSFTGDKLPELVVTARQEKLYPRYSEFHRRQRTGAGFYITWKEIHDKGYNRLADILRNVRGVQVSCQQNSDCAIRMSRSSSCPPSVWVDGRLSDYFGANTPIGDVYGMEVYRGPSELPAEFVGSGLCGAVVLWTKNRTYR